MLATVFQHLHLHDLTNNKDIFFFFQMTVNLKKDSSSIAGVKMMPPPSVSRLRAGGTFYRQQLLAFLDFLVFYYSQRLRTRGLALRAMKKQDTSGTPHFLNFCYQQM